MCHFFHVGLLVITLSSLKLHTENNACMLCASVSCWARFFLQHLRRRFLWLFTKLMIDGSPCLTWNFSDCSVALTFVFLTQQQRPNCVDVFISMRTASAAARTPVDCSELHQQPVDAVLRPTFVQKLCYKLPSVVTFTFIGLQTSKFSLLYWTTSKLAHLLDRSTASTFALFSVYGLKDETLMKKVNLDENWGGSQLSGS